MKTDIKKKWVRALRSGKYKKAQGNLRVEGSSGGIKGYCCLGVLSDLYVKEKSKTFESLNENHVLPVKVMRWAGLTSSNPSVNTKRTGEENLATLNDGNDGYGFRRIADLIEAQF